MTRTFLVSLTLAGNEDLDAIAADIQDSLENDSAGNFLDITVKPWSSPGSSSSSPDELYPISLPNLGA